MAGLFTIFGHNKFFSDLEEHSNCHVVIDGSNLQYTFTERRQAVSNLPAYERAVRNFFQHLLDAEITPHVFFDGPSRGDPYKWERGRGRRETRLQCLISRYSDDPVFESPQPTAIQDIFRDVIRSLGIRSIQVSAKRDYTLEMVLHAKFLDAFLISSNTKFFLEDIPRGFVCPHREDFENFEYRPQCIMWTFQFKKLSQLIGLEKSPNPFALTMWGVVMFQLKTFDSFTKPFFGKTTRRPDYYQHSRSFWMGCILSDKCRKVPQLKLLQFFLDRTQADAERIISEQLYPGERKQAKLFFAQHIAAQLIEPDNVFDRIEKQIEAGDFCDEDLPKWFLRYLTVECKVIPELMDTLTDRRHHLISLLEDFKKPSVNKTTLRLRRILYGILFADSENDDDGVTVAELDRKGDDLEEIDVKPVWFLWNPENPSETREVPGLKKMEFLEESERLKLFLLSMGVEEKFRCEITTGSNMALYVLAILRYWINANTDIGRKDLLRVLLTALLVEQKYLKPSHIFRNPITLNDNARERLGVDFNPGSVSSTLESYACMHPLALLQNATLFARTLHRLFMQPLGANSDAIETITSEVVFYHISQFTGHMDYEELHDLILDQMDEESGKNFTEVLDLIWDDKAVEVGRLIVRGFVGDDKRP